MYTFRVKAGTHRNGGKTYQAGETVKTPHDLVTLFGKNTFELLEETEETDNDSSDGLSQNEAKIGKDVTDEYPNAEANGLKVFKKGGWYSVTDAKDTDEKLNDKGLKVDDVEEFLETYAD